MNSRLLLLAGTAAAILSLGACVTVQPASSDPVAAMGNVLYLAVPVDQPNPPIGAILISGKQPATAEQTAIARQRVLAYIASLNPTQTARVKARRYVCIVTKPSAGSKGKATCMSWDTQSQSFVGNTAYDLVNPPPVNSTVKFQTFTASYVGEGIGGSSPL